jgi:hypothetical protein
VLYSIADSGKREKMINQVTAGQPEETRVRLLTLAPYCRSTWELVDRLSPDAQATYWSDVNPEWIRDSDAENGESVERLLGAGRPRAAFYCVRFDLEKLGTQMLYRLLTAIAQGDNEPPDHYLPDSYHIQEAFKHIDQVTDLTLDEKAGLEFMFLDVLTQPGASQDGHSGIPNVERYIEQHPEQYVHALAWAFKRSDGKTDPDEYHVPPDRKQRMAELGYKLLGALRRVPGRDDTRVLRADRLAAWVSAIREGSTRLSRARVADDRLGALLAHAPVGSDGVWPCEPVRQVMEDIGSEAMMGGARVGVYNARGVHWRGEGGDQERELAGRYREWAQALQVSHPFVASKLLLELARTYEGEANREDQAARIGRRRTQ